MATMDLVKHYGGEPANFLDIGGSSNPEKVVTALTHHHRRRERARHPVQHLRRHHALRRRGARHRSQALDAHDHRRCRIVIRLTGTNEDRGAGQILAERGLSATTRMDEAVRTVIARAQGGDGMSILIGQNTAWSCRASPAATARSTPSR